MKVKTLVNVNGQNLYNEIGLCEMKSIQPLEDGSLRFSAEYQKEDGTGSDGTYSYSVTGWTVFPMLRLYPLENEFMKFYMQMLMPHLKN